MSDTIHPDAVLTALARIEGTPFEGFVNEFGSNLLGIDFKPLGGMHDGGADGFVETSLLEGGHETFIQSSVRDDVSTKIRSTIKRLREFGRQPTRLYYFSSHSVDKIDALEARLSADLGCSIDIRDGNWISNKINSSAGTRSAYKNHLLPVIARAGISDLSNRTPLIDAPNVAACVFLSYEIDALVGNKQFHDSVLDSLITWSLEGTDPDKSRFSTEDEIRKTILENFPFAQQFAMGSLRHRLQEMSSKGADGKRFIVWHSKAQGYCLPYEARISILEEHARYEGLLERLRFELSGMVLELVPEHQQETQRFVDAQIKVLEAVFKSEGLKIAQLVDDSIELGETTVQDAIENALPNYARTNSEAIALVKFCSEATRRMIYKSTDTQREYLSLLSRTYTLLFLLRYEPKIVEYFQNLHSSYRLVIGGELVVRALSEVGLPEDDRSTQSTFKILSQMGSELILTDHVLDEIISHIRSTDLEYKHNYMELDAFMMPHMASEINKILIRSYYYNKFEGKISSWGSFLNQFLKQAYLHKEEGRQSLKTYLINSFGFKFVETEEVEELIETDRRDALSQKLLDEAVKDDIRLAKVDVENMLYVFALRRKHRETSGGNPLGYRTWWLTEETKIQRALKDEFPKTAGKTAMRPEFIIFCVSLLPSARQVDKAFSGFLPSIHGARIGNRVAAELVKDMTSRAKAVFAMDPARVKAEMELHSNRWQSEQEKRFIATLRPNGSGG